MRACDLASTIIRDAQVACRNGRSLGPAAPGRLRDRRNRRSWRSASKPRACQYDGHMHSDLTFKLAVFPLARRICCREEGALQKDWRRCRHQGNAKKSPAGSLFMSKCILKILNFVWTEIGSFEAQVVDKQRYSSGDNSLQREIEVLLKVGL